MYFISSYHTRGVIGHTVIKFQSANILISIEKKDILLIILQNIVFFHYFSSIFSLGTIYLLAVTSHFGNYSAPLRHE